ncbi:MAG: hypothetical protein EZS26_002366 [Candidatus Ordinivivax streblomastigis]|uniref:F5/8 type C domain-containing protein n=1 Tax=Candidatus Ordinivivax streblomastigis TaxID=2540710 RepID=A0A5M8NZB8_9BACT|nr:MAG: hypothetical protein EZS26_002366 [Candidatus Ordinivivax streblomastigis]
MNRKQIKTGCLVLSLMFITTQLIAQSVVENIAIGKPVSSNVDNLSLREPAKALNGTVNDSNDKWSSSGEGTGAQWITVDLQVPFTIARYVVKHAGYGNEATFLNTANFEIQKSVDGVNFTSVDKVEGNTADMTDKDVSPFTARYVRLQITKAQLGSSRRCAVFEFELYETPASQINANSFYATEGFERFTSTGELKNKYTITGGDISLETVGKTKAVKLQFNGKTEMTVKLPTSTIDLSAYTVWGLDFKFPINVSRSVVKDSEKLYITLTDAGNKTVTVNYPHDNSIWMMDERPWVSWHINMKDFASLNLKAVKDIRIGVNAQGSGNFLIDNISFERQRNILDFTKIIKSSRISEQASVIRKPAAPKGAFWCTAIVKKVPTTYYLLQSWWTSNKDYDTGGVDLLKANNLTGPYTFVKESMPRDFITGIPNWGNFAHTPDIIKQGDTYYIYYDSGRSSDRGGRTEEVGLAWTKDLEGAWNFSQGPILTDANVGVPIDDPTFANTWCFGISCTRMIEKDGEFYLFYKTQRNFQRKSGEGDWGRDCYNGRNCVGYYIGYSILKGSSPMGPFTQVRNSGLRGRGSQYHLYPSCDDMIAEGKTAEWSDPGDWDLEDLTLFRYIDGRYYAVLKDFMGRWNRSGNIDDLVVFVSDNLTDWRVADFPFVLEKTRTPYFSSGYAPQYTKLERPFVFWEDDFRTGSISFAAAGKNIGWTSVIYPIDNSSSDLNTGIFYPKNAQKKKGSCISESCH